VNRPELFKMFLSYPFNARGKAIANKEIIELLGAPLIHQLLLSL